MWIKLMMLGVIAICCSGTAQARDPFQPAGLAAEMTVTSSDDGAAVKLLADQSLGSMQLIGLITAEDDAVAVMQTRDLRRIFVRVEGQIGRENARVKTMDIHGLEVVTADGETITIPVQHVMEKVQ